MTDIQTRPNRLPWPPIIYLIAIAISIALGLLYPLPWISAPLSDILFAAGWLLVAAMVALDFSAMRTMARAKTTIRPDKASESGSCRLPSPPPSPPRNSQSSARRGISRRDSARGIATMRSGSGAGSDVHGIA
jgi:hypothetical protein